ncbi:serine hydrolase domain-containing protein [Amycolatopsis jiangsuensis]|uniref:CubicO group peptidase (Beta-lactamase class C family) n=1 Tax=Amycolatopsis jiangsuensis TaxID=1181879 RepID=A0A840IQF4_9PSEU|nr:serine hydrolase domain-containing protein [Amycolatopsis jiangsuensis]MBB4683779.1 CubicO group peptidase (beta-lactamase class C family) [Amycolatopsis jiangsuensis]
MTTIHGFAEEGFGPVADAFRDNFARGAETGAALAIHHRGRLVVDVHGGLADATAGQPWNAGTVAVAFSATKGLLALAGYLAQQRGLLDFDAPVTSLWPEFGAHGKENTTIRDVFAHRAGLVALDTDLTFADLTRWTPVTTAIEAQRPQWEPGTDFAYHALTFGWLTGEILRRATGLRPHELLAEYLSAPLAADAWIGLPADIEPRVARIHPAPEVADAETRALFEKVMAMPAVLRSMTLGGALPARFLGDGPADFNSPALHATEIPAANGIMSAAALSRIYAAAVSTIDGTPQLLDDKSIADAVTPRSAGDGWPGVLTPPGIRFSTGFLVNGYPGRPLLSDRSFGHDGANGGLGFADADAEIGFGYLNNQLANPGDERANRLTAALRKSLGARSGYAAPVPRPGAAVLTVRSCGTARLS